MPHCFLECNYSNGYNSKLNSGGCFCLDQLQLRCVHSTTKCLFFPDRKIYAYTLLHNNSGSCCLAWSSWVVFINMREKHSFSKPETNYLGILIHALLTKGHTKNKKTKKKNGTMHSKFQLRNLTKICEFNEWTNIFFFFFFKQKR